MRYLEPFLIKDLEKHMVLLSGPRQCGKTTLSKALLNAKFRGEYYNWDQVKDRARIQKQDWDESAELVVLDEIHKKKAWKSFMKGIYDTRPASMRLLVTGSARLELFQKAGDSMFGRYRSWRLHPFCFGEDPLSLSPQERFERLLDRGGFPFPYLTDDESDVLRWRNQRWETLLRTDVRDLDSIKNIQALELLAEILKSSAGGMLSYANLAEDVEIAPKTAKAWVKILEKLYLVFLVTPYSGSIKRALSKTPKLYFIDSGDLVERPFGVRVENLVALNLLKRLNFYEDAFGQKMELQYLRDKEGREVDFVITLKQKPIALIEVKTSFQDPDSSLLYFKERLSVSNVIQLHADHSRKRVVKKGVTIMPLQEFFDQPFDRKSFLER